MRKVIKTRFQEFKTVRSFICQILSLYHSSKTALQAREDVQAVCRKLQINLERCIATQWGPDWAAICGEDFK